MRDPEGGCRRDQRKERAGSIASRRRGGTSRTLLPQQCRRCAPLRAHYCARCRLRGVLRRGNSYSGNGTEREGFSLVFTFCAACRRDGERPTLLALFSLAHPVDFFRRLSLLSSKNRDKITLGFSKSCTPSPESRWGLSLCSGFLRAVSSEIMGGSRALG